MRTASRAGGKPGRTFPHPAPSTAPGSSTRCSRLAWSDANLTVRLKPSRPSTKEPRSWRFNAANAARSRRPFRALTLRCGISRHAVSICRCGSLLGRQLPQDQGLCQRHQSRRGRADGGSRAQARPSRAEAEGRVWRRDRSRQSGRAARDRRRRYTRRRCQSGLVGGASDRDAAAACRVRSALAGEPIRRRSAARGAAQAARRSEDATSLPAKTSRASKPSRTCSPKACSAWFSLDIAKWAALSVCAGLARDILKAGKTFCPHYLGGGSRPACCPTSARWCRR